MFYLSMPDTLCLIFSATLSSLSAGYDMPPRCRHADYFVAQELVIVLRLPASLFAPDAATLPFATDEKSHIVCRRYTHAATLSFIDALRHLSPCYHTPAAIRRYAIRCYYVYVLPLRLCRAAIQPCHIDLPPLSRRYELIRVAREAQREQDE